jgi:hypothetical protein
MSDIARTSRAEVARYDDGVAFGETFGLEVPTRISPQIHDSMNAMMAADAILTPTILGFSGRVVWLCRLLGGLHLLFRTESPDLPLRRRLELEALTGMLLIGVALRGTLSRNILEQIYLLIGGVMMVGNSVMTEIE